MNRIEHILDKNGYPETWQSEGLKKSMQQIAIDFKEWCNEKQISHVRNGYQSLTTEQLFIEFNNFFNG